MQNKKTDNFPLLLETDIMTREKETASWTLCMRPYLLIALFSVWINLIYGIKIQPIPEYPVVNQPVTLIVSGVSGEIQSFSWYKGPSTENSSLILTYTTSAYSVQTQGPKYMPHASGLSGGSIKILKLYTSDTGTYTVQIQADSLTQESIYLPVYGVCEEPINCTGVSVAIVGSLLIIFSTILLYMRYKYLSTQTTGQANSKCNQPIPHHNITDPTMRQSTREEPSHPEYSRVDSEYARLQDRPSQTYSDLNMEGTRN